VVQYVLWVGKMLRGEFGEAIVLRWPVAELISQSLPYSLRLGALAFLFSSIGRDGSSARSRAIR
jgi:peptide/nickel transport system permease protein